MSLKTKSWKTSFCSGVVAIAGGLAVAPLLPDWARQVAGGVGVCALSLGLAFARDNDKTSEQVGAGGRPVEVPPAEPTKV